MPKKESAKEKAANKAEAAEDARRQAAEDAEWSQGAKGGDKKAAAEAKRQEELARKAERAALEEEELEGETSKAAAKQPAKKMTQAQIQANFIIPKKKVKNPKPEVEENINHKIRDEAIRLAEAGVDAHTASGVDQATSLLTRLHTGKEEEVDAHPERRRKAAFKAYEEREIPIVRADNPGLKLSQVKEIIFKAWQKSAENPVNQEAA